MPRRAHGGNPCDRARSNGIQQNAVKVAVRNLGRANVHSRVFDAPEISYGPAAGNRGFMRHGLFAPRRNPGNQDDFAFGDVVPSNTSLAAITVLLWIVTVSSTFCA